MENATRLLEQLDVREIGERIEQIDAERKALMVLLRAARQRERRQQPVRPERREGQR